MPVHLVNPSDVEFGVGMITPRWLYVLGIRFDEVEAASRLSASTCRKSRLAGEVIATPEAWSRRQIRDYSTKFAECVLTNLWHVLSPDTDHHCRENDARKELGLLQFATLPCGKRRLPELRPQINLSQLTHPRTTKGILNNC